MSVEENFIPWSMIEPLLEEGMTALGFKLALFSRLGLNPDSHRVSWEYHRGSIADRIRLSGGVNILSEAQAQAKLLPCVDADEPVR